MNAIMFVIPLCLFTATGLAQQRIDLSSSANVEKWPSMSTSTVLNKEFRLIDYQRVPATDGRLGKGFSTLASEWRGDCIEMVPQIKEPTKAKKLSSTFELDYVENLDTLRTILDVSASASANYGAFKGEASARYFRETYSSSLSNYLVLAVRVTSDPIDLPPVRLTLKSLKYLQKSPDEFYRMCGNYYASNVVLGGQYVVFLEIRSGSDYEYHETKADLSATYKGVKGEGAAFSAVQAISKKYQLNIKTDRKGPTDALPDEKNPEAILKYAREFTDKVKRESTKISYGLSSYDTIDPRAFRYRRQELSVNDLFGRLVDAKDQRKILDFASRPENSALFYPALSSSDQKALGVLYGRYEKNIAASILACIESPKTGCDKNIEPLSITMPRRILWQDVNARTDSWQKLLEKVRPDETMQLATRGLWGSHKVQGMSPLECCIEMRITYDDGRDEEIFRNKKHEGNEFRAIARKTIKGPATVWVRIDDWPFDDNVNRTDKDKAQVGLYR